MKRVLFSIFFTAILIFASSASTKLSLPSRVKLDAYNKAIISNSSLNLKSLLPLSNEDNVARINTFITLKENSTLSDECITNLDIDITDELGNIIIASVPLNNVEKLEAIDAIEFIEFEQPVNMLCDSARIATKVNDIHNGFNLPQAYKGKDVIVGVIDCGIDFNHINFKDENKNSRIKLAACYNSSTKAIEFLTDSADIAELTTDYTDISHGSHVAGIAGGSYYDSNFYGMAPESDLILCGLGTKLGDTYVLSCIKKIFQYAQEQGKPAVVNISLGTNAGPHDGTSSFNRGVDNVCKEGNIVVFASGNEGEDNLYLKKEFTDSSTTVPQVASIIYSSSTSYSCEVDAWSNKSEPFGVQFFIYDTTTKTELASSQTFYPTKTSMDSYTWSGFTLSSYFNGSVSVSGMTSSYNNRYQLYTLVSGKTLKSNYRIGVKFYGKQGTVIEAWSNQAQFDSYNNSNYTTGTPDGSFNAMATGKKAISIGAYSTKRKFTSITGSRPYYPSATEGDIASFSSYGTDIYGKNYPDVVAPGFTIISSVNEYDNATITNRKYLAYEVSLLTQRRSYHWADMVGTSMAAPVATGTVALWLQADPTLTPKEIRDIMIETATTDSYTQSGKAIQWGAGKLNAYAGLVKVLQNKNNSAFTDITSPNEVLMIYPNPSNGNFSFYAHNENQVKLSILSLNGATIFNEMIDTDNGLGYVNAEGALAPGIYIVNIVGAHASHSTRLIIR